VRRRQRQQQPAAAAAANSSSSSFDACCNRHHLRRMRNGGSVQMINKTNLWFKSDEHLGHRLRTVAKTVERMTTQLMNGSKLVKHDRKKLNRKTV